MFLQIDKCSYNVETGIISKDNNEYKLTKIQKTLLDYFIANPKKVISKETLMQEVWGRIVTDNTINKFVSTLRSYIEDDASNPKIIVTHFGHGLSFEGKTTTTTQHTTPNKQTSFKHKTWFFAVLLISATILSFAWLNFSKPSLPTGGEVNLQNTKHILVLPTDFNNIEINKIQQTGFSEAIQITVNDNNLEGQIIFDQSELGNREAIEKYWQFDKELVVLQSKVLKNGDIYEAVISLTQGAKVLDETTLSSKNLNALLNNQINFIANYQGKPSEQYTSKSEQLPEDTLFIEALGHKKIGQVNQAKELLQQVLQKQESYYQARFELAKIHLAQKEYSKSLSQLNTLKSTHAYDVIGTEIELAIAKIHFIKHEYNQLISQLKEHQTSSLTISEVKKAKIKIQIGNAYLALGDLQNAMKFFQQALSEIDEEFNPGFFAQSYYGQGKVLIHQSNAKGVYDFFEKSLKYAKVAGNLKFQILALDEMAKMLLVSNEWEKGIALKKQAIEIMELENDKSEVAKGLGTLAAFLIQSGHFTEAKKVNNRMGKIAQELDLDTLTLNYLHYDAIILLNLFKFDEAENQINKQLDLALEKNNYGMQLDNAFLEFELRLARKDTLGFKQEWDKRTQMIQDLGFERYQVYMDLYLARFYKQTSNIEKASIIFDKISEMAKANNDIKILVDAQNQLAEMYIEIDAHKSLDILKNIEQYKPDANPFLEIKALALHKLGKNIEALSLLNQAKLVYHEAWKSENEVLLEQLQEMVN